MVILNPSGNGRETLDNAAPLKAGDILFDMHEDHAKDFINNKLPFGCKINCIERQGLDKIVVEIKFIYKPIEIIITRESGIYSVASESMTQEITAQVE